MQQLKPLARGSDESPQRALHSHRQTLVFKALLLPATHMLTLPDVTTGGGSMWPGAVSPCPSQVR